MNDDSFYVCLNAGPGDLAFRLPGEELGTPWQRVLDTAAQRPFGPWEDGQLAAGGSVLTAGRCVVLLRSPA